VGSIRATGSLFFGGGDKASQKGENNCTPLLYKVEAAKLLRYLWRFN